MSVDILITYFSFISEVIKIRRVIVIIIAIYLGFFHFYIKITTVIIIIPVLLLHATSIIIIKHCTVIVKYIFM